MIERVVENWLTRVNERQYQFPFCQVLVSKGFRVLHLSSHGPQEQGKDILAIDPEGTPIAYQLKTGDIDLATLRKIHGELVELVEVPIQFPGIPAQSNHRAVLVTNGVLNDTARHTLDGFNKGLEARRLPKIEVLLRDSLLRDFIDLHGTYLPIQLSDVEELLRFYTREGTAPLPRGEFASFILNNVPMGDLPKRFTKRAPRRKIKQVKPKPKDVERHLASTALLVSYALYPFMAKGNHWAVFEGWIIFASHVLAVAERFGLNDPAWRPTFDLAFLAARTALKSLVEETLSRQELLEGDVLVDNQVYKARMTTLLGLVSLFDMLCRVRNEQNPFDSHTRKFVDAHRKDLHLWGETAVPYLMLFGFYLEKHIGSRAAESLWGGVLSALVNQNRPRDEGERAIALSDPYLEIEEAIAWSIGLTQEPERERPDYDGQAYTLRALVMLLARRLRRRLLAANWHGITGVSFIEMFPSAPWGMLLWRVPTGDLRITLAKRPQSWAQLLDEARNLGQDELPKCLAARPDFLAAFVTVFPHRLRADSLSVIDDAL